MICSSKRKILSVFKKRFSLRLRELPASIISQTITECMGWKYGRYIGLQEFEKEKLNIANSIDSNSLKITSFIFGADGRMDCRKFINLEWFDFGNKITEI